MPLKLATVPAHIPECIKMQKIRRGKKTSEICISGAISFNLPPSHVAASFTLVGRFILIFRFIFRFRFRFMVLLLSRQRLALSSVLSSSCLGSYHKLLLKLHIIRWHQMTTLGCQSPTHHPPAEHIHQDSVFFFLKTIFYLANPGDAASHSPLLLGDLASRGTGAAFWRWNYGH